MQTTAEEIRTQRIAQATKLLDAGRRKEAKELVEKIVRDYPMSVEALLCLAHITENDNELNDILVTVLEINLDNQTAMQWLSDLRSPDPQVPPHLKRLGRYRLVQMLGSGTMEVFKAIDLEGIEFAIKVLPPAYSHRTDYQNLLQREILATQKLSHPGVVKVYGQEKDADTETDYIVMDCVKGNNLNKEINKLSIAESVEIIRQCCQVLGYCHREGVYHRDIKPSNIMIVRGDEGQLVIKLLDFGLAEVIRSSMPDRSSKLRPVGTLYYFAPELFEPQRAKRRRWHRKAESESKIVRRKREATAIDMYALGVVFYQLLTKVLPYEGSHAEIVMKIIRGGPVPPHKKDSGIPEQLSRIVISLLAKNPYDRPTAKQLNQGLRNLDVLPEWISPFAGIIGQIPSLVFGEIIAVGVAWLVTGIKLSVVGAFVILVVLIGLLYVSACWFLYQWFQGIRNSAHLVWSGGFAIGCGLVLMVFFFSSFANYAVPSVVTPLPTAAAFIVVPTRTPTMATSLPTATTLIMIPTETPTVAALLPTATTVRPTRRPIVVPTPQPIPAAKVDLLDMLDEFFTLEDRTDAIRIFMTLGALFGALLGLAGLPGADGGHIFSSIIGAFVGSGVGAGLGLLIDVLLGVVNALESVFP